MSVSNVGKPLVVSVTFKFMKKLTVKRNHMSANSVAKRFVLSSPLESMKEHTVEKSPTNA